MNVFPKIEIQLVGLKQITRWDIVLKFDNQLNEFITYVDTEHQAKMVKESLEKSLKKIKQNLLQITRTVEENNYLIEQLNK